MSRETGFPSPAQGYEAAQIDLNTLLINNRPATFFMRMSGVSLERKGIIDGDLLVIDRSITPKSGTLIVYQTENSFYCREIIRTNKGLSVRINKDKEEPINENMILFGVVSAVIRKLW